MNLPWVGGYVRKSELAWGISELTMNDRILWCGPRMAARTTKKARGFPRALVDSGGT